MPRSSTFTVIQQSQETLITNNTKKKLHKYAYDITATTIINLKTVQFHKPFSLIVPSTYTIVEMK